MSDLARDTGISVPTVRRWLSILQASYQIYLLEPFHVNLSKRLVKAPKIYFCDTALASYLMGIHDPVVLNQGLFLGPLFETAVVLEHLKWASFSGVIPTFSYFRTNDGLEVDLFIETAGIIHAREIKTSRTLNPSLVGNLLKTEKLLQKSLEKCLLAPVERASKVAQNVEVKPWWRVEW